ncbi:MAG: hypothetical protein COS92_03550 [Desulfobacterales bacterium CG07_land_8_20_14_0_80_52_14]|nr:MAG: hypothetical protein COS92_03550 [Desulfobacterales bacterium CG07_land_8_20_14_0_80_52_14]PJB37254.1 MAG: hypothetical protein CO107_05340 [Deltaproteobacteria bacterium CG_4_9_14_3_um_filter_51_14]
MAEKIKKVSFTLRSSDHQTWNHIADELIQRNVFRNKTEIFECLIYFLQRSKYDEIKEFKSTSIIL